VREAPLEQVAAVPGIGPNLAAKIKDAYGEGSSLRDAVRMSCDALAAVEEKPVEVANLEAAVLDRSRGRRKFRRLTDEELAGYLAG